MGTKKLGILLSTPPENKNFNIAVSLIKEAVDQDIAVYLYFIDDGVYALERPEIKTLSDAGVHLFSCAYGAKRRGISKNEFVVFAGLVTLSDMIKGCDRFLAFN
ncbi:MAG: DsrE family protein [Nitrospirota bacterium]